MKSGMADRGMGIRLFNSKEQLQEIFEGFESDDEDEDAEDGDNAGASRTAVVTSQLRHFVVQVSIAVSSNRCLTDPRLLGVFVEPFALRST